MDNRWCKQGLRRLTATAVTMAIFCASSATADDRAVPTFEKTRPKGERTWYPALPQEKPPVPDIRFGNFRPYNEIDHFILAAIKERKARPRPLCNDWDFARRASLDLVGVVPSAADLERYDRWKKKERRARWINLLLAQQQYADHWTSVWGDLLRETGRIRGAPPNALKHFIHASLLKNRPYDQWVRAMITAEGKAHQNDATAFVLRDRADPKVLTVTVTQTFLGLQLKCAECHNHPFDWWFQSDFEGMADFWRGTRARVYKSDKVFRGGRKVDVPFMEVRTNERQGKGRFLTGTTSEQGRGREALADLITRADNPYFARVAVNRLWHKMMGLGLVNPVDNFSTRNPASHPELLDWLALDFIESGYDLKHILRLIANSRTYQQSTTRRLTRTALPESKEVSEAADLGAGALFDGMMLRRMTAEQVQDSILVATGRYLPESREFVPSIQVTYPPNPRSFLRAFGCTDREALLPRNTSGSIQQALTLLNGDLVNRAVALHRDHPIRYWQKARGFSAEQIVDAIFVQILTRPPTPYERQTAIRYVFATGGRDKGWEDLQWALLNTREFQFIR